MKLLIDSSNFAKRKHLAYDGESYSWVTTIDEDSIVLCGNSEKKYSIDHICSLLEIEKPTLLDEAQKNSFKELGVELNQVPAIWIYSPEKFKSRLKEVTEWASDIYDTLDGYSYINTLRKEIEVLLGMESAMFDSVSFNR